MTSYAQLSDLTALGVQLNEWQLEAAQVLLEQASARLRVIAERHKVDIDERIADEETGEDYAAVVKGAVVQAVLRALNSLGDSLDDGTAAVSQETQSALGYSLTATYVNAGQTMYFLKNELKELGIIRQLYGGLEVYAANANSDKGDNGNS